MQDSTQSAKRSLGTAYAFRPWTGDVPVVKTILLSTSATVLLWLAPLAGAQEVFTDDQWSHSTATAPSAQPTGEIVGKSLLSIGLSLVAVLALAILLGWLVKRLGVKRLVQAKGQYLEVIESVPVAFKRQVSLLRLGDQVVLVGVGEHEVTHLATMPASILVDRERTPAAVAEVQPSAPPATPPDPAFRTLLGKVLKR